MYIDLDYYLANGGSDMEGAAFSRSEYRARRIVDRVTQGRVKVMPCPPEAVQRLMVELVMLESTQAGNLADKPPVASFSNDGYSETYAEPLTAEKVQEVEEALILEYLSGETDHRGTPLLYLGVG